MGLFCINFVFLQERINMESREKARELVGIYLKFVSDYPNNSHPFINVRIWRRQQAQQMAAECVNQIIYSYTSDPYKTLQPKDITPLVYWREVKEQIFKI